MPPRHKKSRRSREGSDGLIISLKMTCQKTKSREIVRWGHLRRVPLRENNLIRNISFPAGFLTRILPQGPFPSLIDSGTIAFRTCPRKRTSDAHSGATATDFHRVPFLLIRPEVGPNRKAFYSISQRATTRVLSTVIPVRLQVKNFFYSGAIPCSLS
jgi:hypothetical protein